MPTGDMVREIIIHRKLEVKAYSPSALKMNSIANWRNLPGYSIALRATWSGTCSANASRLKNFERCGARHYHWPRPPVLKELERVLPAKLGQSRQITMEFIDLLQVYAKKGEAETKTGVAHDMS